MKFTDTHCHLDFRELANLLPDLITQCACQGINQILIPGITAKRWSRVISVCQQYTNVYPALGLHPWWINKATFEHLDLLEKYIATEKLVAVGEIGIDGAIDNIEKQTLYFQKQLLIANKSKLPVLIHHRKSHQLILPILKRVNMTQGGVIHAFSGSYQQAKQYVDLGFKLGIGGTITYARAKKTQNAIKRLPVDCLLLETDAPAMPLEGFQGVDNSPLKLVSVFESLCHLRTEPAEQLALQIEKNVEQIFKLKSVHST